MKVIVEFDMVDMSMHKHVSFFEYLLRKHAAGIRSIKIVEPDEREIENQGANHGQGRASLRKR